MNPSAAYIHSRQPCICCSEHAVSGGLGYVSKCLNKPNLYKTMGDYIILNMVEVRNVIFIVHAAPISMLAHIFISKNNNNNNNNI